MGKYYLKPAVEAALLKCAWTYLILFLPTAYNKLRRYLKTMQFCVQNSQIHNQSVKTPKLLSSSFIYLEGKKSDEAISLIHQTKKIGKISYC